ncbi:DUF1704 domain-containing protein [Candidatus Dojkabacteria bacterium]|nr:DUF1704 domain-containing protein [Candidatus Dojkabacteria bacterium]
MTIFQILRNRNKVLGQNARNLLFIQKEGNTRGRKIADDKLLTKKILASENIPSPELLGVIKDYSEFEAFNWNKLPASFVMKPVQGAQGAGIEIFYNRDKNGNWIKSDGSRVSAYQIKSMALEILDGKYSLRNEPDQAFFEERIRTHDDLKNYTYKGTPDIRVVTYNKIPIMAYVRFPTKESKGKANMIKGAVGTGIDLASGITTTSTYGKGSGGKGYPIEFVPGTKLPFQGLEIPHWNEILKYASKAIDASGLNFGAVDFLIDNEKGPVIVELNARPGLSIQIVNRRGLAWRLYKAKGLEVKNSDHGIRIGKDLFGGEVEEKIERISGKEIISNIMPATIIFKDKKVQTMSLVDTSRRTSIISSQIAMKLGILEEKVEEGEYEIVFIKIKLGNQTIDCECRIINDQIKGYNLSIGRKDLGNFIIDVKKIEGPEESKLKENIYALLKPTKIKKLDEAFEEFNKILSIIPALRPRNVKEEKEKFFKKNCDYNPQFEYKPLKFDPDKILDKLELLNPPFDSIGRIYRNKIKEYKKMVYLMETIGHDPHTFTQRSIELFGQPNRKIRRLARKILKNHKITIDKNPEIPAREVGKRMQEALDKYKLDYPIKFSDKRTKMSIGKSSGRIKLPENRGRSEDQLNNAIGHEILTHLLRLHNGKKKKELIWKIGTPRYIITEEGLATIVGHSRKKDKVFKIPSLLIILMNTSLISDFKAVYNKAYKYIQDENKAWNYTVRFKRGISDTSSSGAFTKDLYLKWAIKTGQYIVNNPKSLGYLWNGKANPNELMEFTKPSDSSTPISIKDVKKVLKANYSL